MPIFMLLALIPFLLGLGAQYAVCRLTMARSRWWKGLPPLAALALAAAVALGRWRVWTSREVAPWTQLIFVPGLPALLVLLGMLAGWRIWRRLWLPRVIRR